MSEAQEIAKDVVARRARLAGLTAIIAGIVIAAVSVILEILGVALNPDRWVFFERRWEWRRIFGNVLQYDIANALVLAASGVLILLLARVIAAPARPTFAPVLDRGFRRRAYRFSTLTIYFACLYFVAMVCLSVSSRIASATGREGIEAFYNMFLIVGHVLGDVRPFLLLILAAFAIQMLLSVAGEEVGEQEEAPAPEEEPHE